MVPLSAVTLATFLMRMVHFFAGILFLMPPAVSAHQEAASLEEVVITGRRDHLAGRPPTGSRIGTSKPLSRARCGSPLD